MNVLDAPRRLNQRIDGWLTAPEVNAAGRMGLFRILYGLFLLWTGSQGYFTQLGQLPVAAWKPIGILTRFPQRFLPSAAFYQFAEFALIAAIVLLIIGYHVRLMTVLVFCLGFGIEALRMSIGRVEHGNIFQAFYIPLVMILSQWGATYSLDAELKARRTGVRVAPSDSSWIYAWPIRILLLLLSILYLSAAYWKWAGSPWLTNPNVFVNFLLNENVDITIKGAYAAPLLVLIAQIPIFTTVLRFMTMGFELVFFTSLLNRRLRNFWVSFAIIFHTINALLMYIQFTYVLIAYALFVDWQHYYERWWPKSLRLRLEGVSSRRLIGGALIAAVAFALLWQLWAFRGLFSLWGLLDWRTIWIPLLPFGVIGFVRAVWVLLSEGWRAVRRMRNGGARTPVTG